MSPVQPFGPSTAICPLYSHVPPLDPSAPSTALCFRYGPSTSSTSSTTIYPLYSPMSPLRPSVPHYDTSKALCPPLQSSVPSMALCPRKDPLLPQ
jgi:hypothetical protein